MSNVSEANGQNPDAGPEIESWSKGYSSGYARAVDDLSARQPVGQEPVAWVSPGQLEEFRNGTSSFGSRIPARIEKGGLFDMPLYASPPAQAVDLGQFRIQVAELLRREFDLEVADPEDHRHDDGAGDADRIAGTIAALIDCHADREPNSEPNRLTERAESCGQASIITKDSTNG